MKEEEINEEWRNIIGFEGKYQVSNLGRVKSLRNAHNKPREMILKLKLNRYGYYDIKLCKNGKQKWYRVHRLVALAFIPNPNNLPQVNHRDEDKTNNCVENLEWCDCKYNCNYGTAIERKVKNTDYKKIAEKIDWEKRREKVLNIKSLSKPILQLDLNGNVINEYPSIIEAGRQNGIHYQNICACLKGKQKTAYGYIWKYK